MNQQQPSDCKHLQSNQELTCCKLSKRISKITLFYDTSCCDMVPRHAAIKSIGSKAIQESSIPISIGGVKNTAVKSNHGAFFK